MLVNYYSRTGNNRKLAEFIARKFKADIEEIREVRKPGPPLPSDIFRAILRIRPKIVDLKNDPAKADKVILLLPVWAAHIPGPVRTYLKRYNPNNLAVISINGGWKTRCASKLAEKSLMLTLPKGTQEIDKIDAYKKEVEEFVKSLK